MAQKAIILHTLGPQVDPMSFMSRRAEGKNSSKLSMNLWLLAPCCNLRARTRGFLKTVVSGIGFRNLGLGICAFLRFRITVGASLRAGIVKKHKKSYRA